MLGSNYSTNGNGLDWPHCGEMDILEHTGKNLNMAQMTAHHPDVSPGVGDTKKFMTIMTYQLIFMYIL
ncbi:MAG: hypothetical protein CM15mP102_14020 [Flavobacteriales bacterium]|nr:MAG: hypothetical protein CM15mP102_14020 [Flavobacteriales bacterium]